MAKSSFLSSLLHKVCQELAEWYFQDGCSVLAACCHLAVDNIKVHLCAFHNSGILQRIFFLVNTVA